MWQQLCLSYKPNALVTPLDYKLRRGSDGILALRLVIRRNRAKDYRRYLAHRVKASSGVDVSRYVVLLSSIPWVDIVELNIDTAGGWC